MSTNQASPIVSQSALDGTPSPETTSNLQPGESRDPNDGNVWIARCYNPVPLSRLGRLTVEVTPATQHIKIDGKIRGKLVQGKAGPKWIHHKEDSLEHIERPNGKQGFADPDRQLIPAGEYEGKLALSPRRVAEELLPDVKLEISIPLVEDFATNGVPWVYDDRGRKHKPTIVPLKYGYYGSERGFWLENEVAEFKHVLADLRSHPIVRHGKDGAQGPFIVVEPDLQPWERIWREGEWWINTTRAAKRIGCCEGSLIVWKKNGCDHLLNSKCPDVYEHQGKEYDGRPGFYFRETEVWTIADGFKAAELFAKDPPKELVVDGVECIAVVQAEKVTGKDAAWLHNHVECKTVIRRGSSFAYFPVREPAEKPKKVPAGATKATSIEALMAKKPLPPRPVNADADADVVVGTGSDLIFYEEAEGLLNCSRQTIDRIRRDKRNKDKRNKPKINIYENKVADSIGKDAIRHMLSRTELLELFVRKPAFGEPIIVPESIPRDAEFIRINDKLYARYVDPADGREQTRALTKDGKYLAHPWYLRKDAKEHYDCSDEVLNKDRSLKTRSFYIIRESKGRQPKRVIAYCGWDLDDIEAGRLERKGYRKAIKEFMTEIKQHLPILASDAHALVKEARFDGKPFGAPCPQHQK